MTKIKYGNIVYWSFADLDICFMSTNQTQNTFYTADNENIEEYINQYEMGNIISLDLIFININ